MLTLKDLIIHPTESLKSAMQRMTRNRRGLLFVCDEDSHLVGVLSDGDVRRSLLDDTLLVSPVSQIMNTDPITAPEIESARELLQKGTLVAVPVVDSEGRMLQVALEGQDEALKAPNHGPDSATAVAAALSVVAVIPARGGSKRIPRKNLALLRGRSLLSWAIRTAKGSQRISRVIVTTDDPEIAEESRKLGVEIPWLRPPQFSRDDSPTFGALEHAVQWAVDTLDPAPEFGVLLEPTAPLRRSDHIDAAVGLLISSDADCVMSVSEVPHLYNPEELLTVADGLIHPYLPYRTMDTRKLRGEQSSVYIPNGLVYAFRTANLLRNRSLYGTKTVPFFTPWDEFVDIDTDGDLRLAELRLQKQA